MESKRGYIEITNMDDIFSLIKKYSEILNNLQKMGFTCFKEFQEVEGEITKMMAELKVQRSVVATSISEGFLLPAQTSSLRSQDSRTHLISPQNPNYIKKLNLKKEKRG